MIEKKTNNVLNVYSTFNEIQYFVAKIKCTNCNRKLTFLHYLYFSIVIWQFAGLLENNPSKI